MSFLNRIETPVIYNNNDRVDQIGQNGSENCHERVLNERNFLQVPKTRSSNEEGKRRNAINYDLGMVLRFFSGFNKSYGYELIVTLIVTVVFEKSSRKEPDEQGWNGRFDERSKSLPGDNDGFFREGSPPTEKREKVLKGLPPDSTPSKTERIV